MECVLEHWQFPNFTMTDPSRQLGSQAERVRAMQPLPLVGLLATVAYVRLEEAIACGDICVESGVSCTDSPITIGAFRDCGTDVIHYDATINGNKIVEEERDGGVLVENIECEVYPQGDIKIINFPEQQDRRYSIDTAIPDKKVHTEGKESLDFKLRDISKEEQDEIDSISTVEQNRRIRQIIRRRYPAIVKLSPGVLYSPEIEPSGRTVRRRAAVLAEVNTLGQRNSQQIDEFDSPLPHCVNVSLRETKDVIAAAIHSYYNASETTAEFHCENEMKNVNFMEDEGNTEEAAISTEQGQKRYDDRMSSIREAQKQFEDAFHK
ncbi:unnamed protein product [Orchesella dallaii]|uniref:Uncharacterized protein n=1 Tax=Orchesella dallaii TaxID=48710 RepID=A0ABP1S8I9_9HEXA